MKLWELTCFNVSSSVCSEASVVVGTCSLGSCRRPDPKIPQPSASCSRSGTCRWCRRRHRGPSCAYRQDNATRRGSSHRSWCKQECSLPTVEPSSSARSRSQFWSSSCCRPAMFCCWSFWNRSTCSTFGAGTCARLHGTSCPRNRTSLACWCHHLRKVRDTHETHSMWEQNYLPHLPQTLFIGQQCSWSYCFKQRPTFWPCGSFSTHLWKLQTISEGPPPLWRLQ